MAKLRAHSYKPVFIMRRVERISPNAEIEHFEAIRSDRKILHRFTEYEFGHMKSRKWWYIKGRISPDKSFQTAFLTYQMAGWFIEFKDVEALTKEA